jgi:hypothetical protein
MSSLTLVLGSKSQAPTAAPARDLYLSRWFRLSRVLAESQGRWRVLSTRHGLVSPETVLEPYQPRKNRATWYEEEVVTALLGLTEAGATVTLLSPSSAAAESISRPVRQAGRYLVAPLAGLTLDQQVAWLEERLRVAGLPVPGTRQRTDEEKQARRERRAARRQA